MDTQGAHPDTCALDWRVQEIRADGSLVLESSGDVASSLETLKTLAAESAYVILRTSGRSAGFVRVHRFEAVRHTENTLSVENGLPVITPGSVPVRAGQHVTCPADAFRVKVGDLFTMADGRFQWGETAGQ